MPSTDGDCQCLGDGNGLNKDSMQPAAGGTDVPPSSKRRCAFQTISNQQEILHEGWRHDRQGDDDRFDQVNLILLLHPLRL